MTTVIESIPKRDSMEATISDTATKLQSTHVSQRASTKAKSLGLTDLPPSVRNNIYAHVLDTELVNLGAGNVSYTHSIKDGVLQFKASRPPFPVDTSLFYVNKQISREAVQYFYKTALWIRVEIYSPDARHAKSMVEDSGVLFSTAAPELLERVKQHAMDLTIVEKNSSQKRAVAMFPAQYLPRLINFLDQASKTTKTWAPNHALFMTVVNTHSLPIARLQGDLLELFRLLSNFGAATVDEKYLLPGYAEGLQNCLIAESFTAEMWLKSVTEMSVRMEEAKNKKNWQQAALHGQAAVIAMTYGYLTHPETLHMQKDAFHKAVQRLRWRVELGVGNALAQLHASVTEEKGWLTNTSIPLEERQSLARDLLRAETATSQALSLAADSPNPDTNPWFQSLPAELIPPNKKDWFTEADQGESWYAAGLVHMSLGEYLFAAGDLERASQLCKGKVEVDEAFKKAREGIDWNVKPGTGLRMAGRLAKKAEA